MLSLDLFRILCAETLPGLDSPSLHHCLCLSGEWVSSRRRPLPAIMAGHDEMWMTSINVRVRSNLVDRIEIHIDTDSLKLCHIHIAAMVIQ